MSPSHSFAVADVAAFSTSQPRQTVALQPPPPPPTTPPYPTRVASSSMFYHAAITSCLFNTISESKLQRHIITASYPMDNLNV
jgi:hypothetical protein